MKKLVQPFSMTLYLINLHPNNYVMTASSVHLQEERGLSLVEFFLWDLASLWVHVDRFGRTDGQVRLKDVMRCLAPRLHTLQPPVALTRHPEVDVFVAELLLEELLEYRLH